ncbi:hypothetical protein KUTeg_015785 [Tegillarca granosa]|uniref:Cadherin domain-containing protein n=1 Tax=Tegillarca granosa TaxID=220873 RepID=A0ABQ9ENG0_TEGGR|nr:hypothetical protein KUTeg_015785 [Tegillarca granosa]
MFNFNTANQRIPGVFPVTVVQKFSSIFLLQLKERDTTLIYKLFMKRRAHAPTIHNLPYTYLLSEDQSQQLLLYTINATDPSDDVTCSITNPNLPPTIHNLAATTSLHEDQILEKLLHTLNITDPTNDAIQCSITNPASSPFFIKPVSGTSDYGIYSQYSPGFDFNTNSQYDLTVSCTDGRNTVTGLFTVTILQNQAPAFTNLDAGDIMANSSLYGTTVPTYLIHVCLLSAAGDIMATSSLYGTTVPTYLYMFVYFRLAGDTMTTSSLYGTTVPTYLYMFEYFWLLVTLWLPGSLYGTTVPTYSYIFCLLSADINNAPSFTNLPLPTPKYIPENSVLGLSVHHVSITDPNSKDTHTFTASYNPIEGAKYFQIDTQRPRLKFQKTKPAGLVSITSQNTINFEKLTSTSFQITVYATDGYAFISESLNVTVTDVNEPPEFDKPYYCVSVDEDLASSIEMVPGFTVTDPDAGEIHKFTMDCGSYQSFFTIDPSSGNITIGTGYDLDTGSYNSTINCTVVVNDGEYSDTALLTIIINQVNDNTPLFSPPTYSFFVSADDGIGTTVGSVTASDGDLSTHIYGKLTYSLDLTSISCDCFAVRENGNIYVKQSLQSFSNGSTLIITTVATDGGNLNDTASVTIVIPQVTTSTTTTTTDRYITFLEDSRNSVWLVLVGFALLGRDWCKPRPRKPSRRPPQIQRFRTPPTLPRPEPTTVVANKFNSNWEAWGMDDFKKQSVPDRMKSRSITRTTYLPTRMRFSRHHNDYIYILLARQKPLQNSQTA